MSLSERLGANRSGRSRRHQPSGLRIAIASFALAVLVGGLGAGWWFSKRAAVTFDAKTNCATDRPPSEVLVLLLDLSDGLSEPQRLEVDDTLGELIDGVKPLGLIDVFAVDTLDTRVTHAVIRACNPGSDRDVNELYQNPAHALARWKEFRSRLDERVDQLLARPGMDVSPVMEAIQATALRTLATKEFANVPKRLVVVSDLLQNVPGRLSHYQGVPDFDDFARGDYFPDVRADLQGVNVEVLYLVRPGGTQPWPQHPQFWERYFAEQGATLQKISPVYGAR